MNSTIREKILSIILASFGYSVKVSGITSDDITAILNIAKRQKILPVITVGLKKLGHSDLLTEELIKGEAKAVFDYTQRNVSLNEISDVLDKTSIPYIPLKGSVIRDLYPEPWMRTSSDIDILIHHEDIDKAIEVLESNTSFKYLSRELHDVHLVSDRVHLELHFSFEYCVDKIDKALTNPWDNCIPMEKAYRYSFTPEYNLFYNVSHAAKHFIQNGGIGIRPILDLFLLRSKTVFDEEKVRSFCEEAGVLGFYETCCKLIDVWFYEGEHDETSKIFEELVLSGGVFGSKHLKIVSNKRRDSGKKYISGRLFKSSKELKEYYPNCRKHPVLVPFYQVVRWTKVFKVKKTKSYINEFKQADALDQAEVEKYDKLLKAMGL